MSQRGSDERPHLQKNHVFTADISISFIHLYVVHCGNVAKKYSKGSNSITVNETEVSECFFFFLQHIIGGRFLKCLWHVGVKFAR